MSLEVRVREIATPFKVAFRHAAAERAASQSVWIEADDGETVGLGEGCPREYVTGESIETALAFIHSVTRDVVHLDDVGALRKWVTQNRAHIDRAPAAWCALELALLDYFARCEAIPVEVLLGLPPLPAKFRYTAVLGDGCDKVFTAQLQQYQALGFREFKLKINGNAERDAARIGAINTLPGTRLRLDANNLWHELDAFSDWRERVSPSVFAVEEPLATHDIDDLRAAGDVLGAPIILDENFLRLDQLQSFSREPERWIVNIRVSKMGGLLRSLELAEAAREAGIRIVVGAQVGETSVLTRAALPVAATAGELLVGQEGAFGEYLLDHDLVEPPLQFGKAGLLEPEDIVTNPGWGFWGLEGNWKVPNVKTIGGR